MKQKQMVNAYITLVRLGGAPMSVKAAHDLYLLRKKLEPTYQFCVEQEQMIVEKYNGRAVNGTITFSDEETVRHAHAALQELYDLEVEFESDAVTVKLDDIKGGTLSVNDLETLEGFVALI